MVNFAWVSEKIVEGKQIFPVFCLANRVDETTIGFWIGSFSWQFSDRFGKSQNFAKLLFNSDPKFCWIPIQNPKSFAKQIMKKSKLWKKWQQTACAQHAEPVLSATVCFYENQFFFKTKMPARKGKFKYDNGFSILEDENYQCKYCNAVIQRQDRNSISKRLHHLSVYKS